MKKQNPNPNPITNESTQSRELVATRLINAPRELVFKVWTEAEHIAQWWGPNGFTNTISEMTVVPGGVWRFIMHGPDGSNFPNRIEYKEVVKPERLVFKHSDDMEGGMAFHVEVTFEDHNGKTQLTMRILFNTVEERERVVNEYGAIEGNKQTLDRLEAYLLVRFN